MSATLVVYRARSWGVFAQVNLRRLSERLGRLWVSLYADPPRRLPPML